MLLTTFKNHKQIIVIHTNRSKYYINKTQNQSYTLFVVLIQQECIPVGCIPGYLGRYPSGRYTPGQVHPSGRYTPGQVHLQGRYTPPGRYIPQAGTPPRQCILGYCQQVGPCGQTDTCKNITFANFVLRAVKINCRSNQWRI